MLDGDFKYEFTTQVRDCELARSVKEECLDQLILLGERSCAMCSMNISPTISMNAIIKDSTMSSPSPASNHVAATEPFENPSGWAACSISTSALPDPLPRSTTIHTERSRVSGQLVFLRCYCPAPCK